MTAFSFAYLFIICTLSFSLIVFSFSRLFVTAFRGTHLIMHGTKILFVAFPFRYDLSSF